MDKRDGWAYGAIKQAIAGKTPVSGLRLVQAGMAGHFRRALFLYNSDCKWLDARQLRRLQRAEKRFGLAIRTVRSSAVVERLWLK